MLLGSLNLLFILPLHLQYVVLRVASNDAVSQTHFMIQMWWSIYQRDIVISGTHKILKLLSSKRQESKSRSHKWVRQFSSEQDLCWAIKNFVAKISNITHFLPSNDPSKGLRYIWNMKQYGCLICSGVCCYWCNWRTLMSFWDFQ